MPKKKRVIIGYKPIIEEVLDVKEKETIIFEQEEVEPKSKIHKKNKLSKKAQKIAKKKLQKKHQKEISLSECEMNLDSIDIEEEVMLTKKTIRVGTFNVENLFARYKFNNDINKDDMEPKGFLINNIKVAEFEDVEGTKLSALAIREMNCDILAVQEVEGLQVLDKFNNKFLKKMYKYSMVIDGHDPRQIEVGVLSKFPIVCVKSNRHLKMNDAYLFPRDCLEVQILVEDKPLFLYINHFTSMMKGRDSTKHRRKCQVDKVASIIDTEWKKKKYKGDFIVMGDFNDYEDDNTSLNSLLSHPQLENVVKRLPEKKQWTHYYKGDDNYHQLDYILISKQLSLKNPKQKPVIFRKGQPYRAKKYEGVRYVGVGEDRPKSSDHCPVYIDLIL
eukprot:gene7226-11541_t